MPINNHFAITSHQMESIFALAKTTVEKQKYIPYRPTLLNAIYIWGGQLVQSLIRDFFTPGKNSGILLLELNSLGLQQYTSSIFLKETLLHRFNTKIMASINDGKSYHVAWDRPSSKLKPRLQRLLLPEGSFEPFYTSLVSSHKVLASLLNRLI